MKRLRKGAATSNGTGNKMPAVEMYDPTPFRPEMNGVGSTRVPGPYELKSADHVAVEMDASPLVGYGNPNGNWNGHQTGYGYGNEPPTHGRYA
jgi:hypothetical protein